VDSTNQTSSDLYYAYETNGSKYTLTSFFESTKYAKTMDTSGGVDPALYEIGSGDASLPDLGRGLVGYWPLNEGGLAVPIDWSGSGHNGTWSGAATGTNGYYSPGNVWPWAGAFDGTSTVISVASVPAMGAQGTYSLWVYPLSNAGASMSGPFGYMVVDLYGTFTIYSSGTNTSGGNLPLNTWTFLTVTANNGVATLYKNGVQTGVGPCGASIGAGALSIGEVTSNHSYGQGFLSDIRVYDRVLSAAEIQEIYNAEK
jgi:hypothetical protein